MNYLPQILLFGILCLAQINHAVFADNPLDKLEDAAERIEQAERDATRESRKRSGALRRIHRGVDQTEWYLKSAKRSLESLFK
ncbi:MAG: hypothetical protein KTR32_22305 [Granulosicoccus sp.]|nr:hypothetical protein [Granulosicoccus sp.]